MNVNLLELCYEGEGGESYIRSINEKGQFYVSLADVLKTLSIENRKIDGKSPKSMLPVIKAVIQTLDPDEIKNIPVIENGQSARSFLN